MSSDKTYGFKVSDEIYQRAKGIIESSGLTSKEWFENALVIYETQNLQRDTPEYANDLKEVQFHTKRIYEHFANMIQQSIHLREDAVSKILLQLDQKDETIAVLQKQRDATTEMNDKLIQANEVLQQQYNEQLNQLEESRIRNVNGQLLIDEYKVKNDNLTGLIGQYKAFEDENKLLLETFAKEKAQLLADANTTKQEIEHRLKQSELKFSEAVTKISKLQADIQTLTNQHELALARKDIEHGKVINRAEAEHQEKIAGIIEQKTERISELQNENDRIRQSSDKRINELQAENERIRNEYVKRIDELKNKIDSNKNVDSE